MPFKTLALDSRLPPASRVLISGPPNSFKTTSIVETWPRPNHLVSYPGEKGYETIPVGEEGLFPYIWQVEDVSKVNAASVLREVEQATADIISGKYGDVTTFAGEGLHKLYGWHYTAALDDLLAGDSKGVGEEALRGPAYGRAHASFMAYITKVLQSTVPYVVMTLWEGTTKDDPENRSKNAPSHIFPDLPGQLAKRIVGEFGVVLYSQVSLPGLDGRVKGQWQLRPEGKVWGVGVKAAPEIAKNLPGKMIQDFRLLKMLLAGASQAEAVEWYKNLQSQSKGG